MRSQPLLGAHLSIAGGIHLAPLRASALSCSVLQVFTKNPVQWVSPPLRADEVQDFRTGVEASEIRSVLAHASYLINLASPQPRIHTRSRRALLEEMERCALLGIPYIVVHPGSHRGHGREIGLNRVSDALCWILARFRQQSVSILLENTSGQGDQLGDRISDLMKVVETLKVNPLRLGLCLDTCHAFAAGYDLRTAHGYQHMIEEASWLGGHTLIRAFHLNDSKGSLGSKIDRHAHIGEGKIGTRAFQRLLQDPRFSTVPKIIETPKEREGVSWDEVNLKLLKDLSASSCSPSKTT